MTDAGARMTIVSPVASNLGGPLPWEAAELSAVRGRRAIVATTADRVSALNGALTIAEEAAATADQFAVNGPHDPYLVFLAGDAADPPLPRHHRVAG